MPGSETDIGVILSQLAQVNLNDSVFLTVDNESVQLKVVGIVQTSQQSDTELIMPLATLQTLSKQNSSVSFIEFTLKSSGTSGKALSSVTQTLPNSVKVTNTQQAATFAQDLNNQAVNFINVWSIVVYAVVIAASFVMATRIINESNYDLYTLIALGVKKNSTVGLIVAYTFTLAFIGTIIGLAVGTVGTQIAATVLRWVWDSSQLAPFLQPEQALQILVIALVSSVFGSIYPSIKAASLAWEGSS